VDLIIYVEVDNNSWTI